MKSNQYFKKELRRHYPLGFLKALFVLIVVFLIPLLFIIGNVKFNPAEFANIYLSSVFMSLLIGVFLQIIQLYNNSHATYFKVNSLLKTMSKLLSDIETDIRNNADVSQYADILTHYKISIFNSLTSDSEVNNLIILVLNSSEIGYISTSIRNSSGSFNSAKKNQIIDKLVSLQNKINISLEQL